MCKNISRPVKFLNRTLNVVIFLTLKHSVRYLCPSRGSGGSCHRGGETFEARRSVRQHPGCFGGRLPMDLTGVKQ